MYPVAGQITMGPQIVSWYALCRTISVEDCSNIEAVVVVLEPVIREGFSAVCAFSSCPIWKSAFARPSRGF